MQESKVLVIKAVSTIPSVRQIVIYIRDPRIPQEFASPSDII